MDILTEIEKIFKAHLTHLKNENLLRTPLFQKIHKKITDDQKLIFLLPAFPGKSPSPDKTSGRLPDFGEVLALEGLQSLCEDISHIYHKGAWILICSDGRVFSDIVRVPDAEISAYQKGIEEILEEFHLTKISLLSLDDLYPDRQGDDLRALLLSQHARSIEEIKHLVSARTDYKKLFNGLHKFLVEDELSLNLKMSKSKIRQEAKARTYELMRRSEAWSDLLTKRFPGELRLSIHPYEVGHDKFGIKLISSSSKWATPWHNVAVKIKDKFELMHLHEAKKLKAMPKFMREKYAYFEVASF